MIAVIFEVEPAEGRTQEYFDLAAALRRLRVPAEALGRSIAFQPTGERRGEDLGQILAIAPGSDRVVALARRSDGGWSRPMPVAPERP